MIPMRLYSFVVAAALASASLAAHADVIYSFVGGGISAGTTFTIDSPDFLSYSATAIPVTTSSDSFSSGNDEGKILSVRFFQNRLQGVTTSSSDTLFNGIYAINQDGVYLTTDPKLAGATLTISGSPAVNPVAVTPEPSSLALLGTGLLGLFGVARKRFA
jgi:hypothetical protein